MSEEVRRLFRMKGRSAEQQPLNSTTTATTTGSGSGTTSSNSTAPAQLSGSSSSHSNVGGNSGGSGSNKRNIFQQCINYRRASTSSASPTLPNHHDQQMQQQKHHHHEQAFRHADSMGTTFTRHHHHHQQETPACAECQRKALLSGKPSMESSSSSSSSSSTVKPKLPPRPATVACSAPRTSSSSSALCAVQQQQLHHHRQLHSRSPVFTSSSSVESSFPPSTASSTVPFSQYPQYQQPHQQHRRPPPPAELIMRPNSVPPPTLSSDSTAATAALEVMPDDGGGGTHVGKDDPPPPPPPSSSQISKPQFDESLKKDGGGGTLQQRTHQQPPPSGSSLVVKEVTTGTTSSSDGGGSSHRLRSPSRSSLSSSLEPISQGVDTLEVCDKAAARLRELANHLEHGDIPNSVLQKTLQYAAYVLDTVSMDETRRCKLKKEPLRPSPTPPPPPPLVLGEALPPPLPPPPLAQTSSIIMPPSHSSSSSSSCVEVPSTLESATLPVSITASAKAVVADPLTSASTTSITSTTSISPASKKSHSHSQHNHHPPHHPPPSHAPSSSSSHRPHSPHSRNTTSAQLQSSTDSVKRVILTQVDPKQTEATIEEATTVSSTGRLSDSTADSLQRRLLDEEDELAEVQPDAVPNEVRQWLASTFTRSQVATKPRSDDKPKFRSVANAIRAGIMVDRIYRRLFNVTAIGIPPEVSTFLKAADEWSFDVFALNVLSPNKVLRNLSAELLNRYGLVHKFKIPSSQLDGFLSAIEQGYMKYGNPYHNNLHAADVTQTVHYMLWVTGLAQWLTDLEVFATLIAAIIHDYQHTGTTNNFHINSNSDITLLYNDRSVLENFHISEAFKVMRKDEANIIQNLSREEYREFRTLIIEMVIATDMSTHFQQVKTLKTLLSHTEFSVDKQKGLSYILHSADISHPSKMFPLHQRWTLLLMEEFFRQGDMEQELGLAYSPLCDRNSTLIPQSQIGFIDFIVAPTMELCGDLIERVHEHINVSAAAAASEAAADDQVAELAAETKSQARSQSSADSTATAKANGSSGPPSSSNTSRNTSSAPAYTRCSAPVILFKKLHRPWLKHLEENKNLWQLKAAEEAKQHADEKLSEAEEEDDEDAPSSPAETEE